MDEFLRLAKRVRRKPVERAPEPPGRKLRNCASFCSTTPGGWSVSRVEVAAALTVEIIKHLFSCLFVSCKTEIQNSKVIGWCLWLYGDGWFPLDGHTHSHILLLLLSLLFRSLYFVPKFPFPPCSVLNFFLLSPFKLFAGALFFFSNGDLPSTISPYDVSDPVSP